MNSASSGSPSPIAVADFNGDGKLDIAVVAGAYTSINESVSVLTGNGDGTFNSPFSSPSSTSTIVTWIQVADFNQDGRADVVLADSSGSATVFLNNGGGLLTESFPVVSGLHVPYYLEVGVGDPNGDGYPDIVAGGYYERNQGLFLTEPTETASASASVQVHGVGRHLAQASFPAEGKYESSISNSIPLWGLSARHVDRIQREVGRVDGQERPSGNRGAPYRARDSRHYPGNRRAGQLLRCLRDTLH